MIREYDYLFKVVIIGNSSVGKSSLLRRFADDSFQESYLATIGVDFRFKYLAPHTRSLTVQGEVVKLQIWDTAGQERFRTITGAYYKGAHAIIVVYDITRKETFEDIDAFWLSQIEKYALPNVHMIIVGNKTDSTETRQVSLEEAETFCKSKGLKHIEASAKTGDNVAEAFQQLSQNLTKLFQKTQRGQNGNTPADGMIKKRKQLQLQSGKQPVTKNSSCCP